MRFLLTLTSVLLFNTYVISQEEDYFDHDYQILRDKTFDPYIRTVQLYKLGLPLSFPIISMEDEEQLHLAFDDFNLYLNDYYYELIHCDALWKPSEITKPEYLEGIPEDIITEYNYSSGMYQKYLHYTLDFPTENMKPLMSGNYIISVFKNGVKDSVVFQKRFMVVKKMLLLEGQVDRAGDPEFRRFKQQLNFSIFTGDYDLSNPYTDMNVVIVQNGNWQSAQFKVQPMFMKGDELDFNLSEDAIFWGWNDYRNVNLRSIRYHTEQVSSIQIKNDSIIAYMEPDLNRAARVYADRGDLNGNFVILNDGSFNPDLDAEYCWTKFYLKSKKVKGKVYLTGSFNNWKKSQENQMTYDSLLGMYTNTFYLKQGYYDYRYELDLSYSPIWNFEGSHWQTDNNYNILVYHRRLSDRSDRLIGYLNLNAIKNNTILLQTR
ncbi:MAG: DUF5103 domain-containing protein [Flavobacteriales bacterium]|nr:DUF5103 domain-containing protein [Flavobacteriales bacterium]